MCHGESVMRTCRGPRGLVARVLRRRHRGKSRRRDPDQSTQFTEPDGQRRLYPSGLVRLVERRQLKAASASPVRACGPDPYRSTSGRRTVGRVNFTDTSDLWWKNAVVYCVDVKTLPRLERRRLGRLPRAAQRHRLPRRPRRHLPVAHAVLSEPDRDDGYDITDYYGVDPRLGTLGDFVEFLRTAHDRGHAGDRRPRAQPHVGRAPVVPVRAPEQRARRTTTGTSGPTTRRRTRRPTWSFPDEETASGSYDEECGEYFLHRFYRSSPTSTSPNPEVRDEIAKIIGFWPAARHRRLPHRRRTVPLRRGPAPPRAHVRRSTRTTSCGTCGRSLGGGSAKPRSSARSTCRTTEQRKFFGGGDGDELSMQFDFIGMQAICLSMARGDARPWHSARRAGPRSTRPASGRTSCATTTSSPSTSSPRRSARRSSTRSARTRHAALRSRAAAPAAAMLDGDMTGSGWPTR